MTFAINDRVELIEDYDGFKKGQQGIVLRVNSLLTVEFDKAPSGRTYRTADAYDFRFKKIEKVEEPAKPKVGDRVVFNQDFHDCAKKGDAGVITNTNNRSSEVKMDRSGETVYANHIRYDVVPALKRGDRATVKGFETFNKDNPVFDGRTGTVESVYDTSITLTFDDDKVHSSGTFNKQYLVPAVEEPRKPGEFLVGDKVRVIAGGFTDSAWVGVEGIVEKLPTAGGHHKVRLTTSPKGREGRYPVGYLANLGANLELVEEPKPFTYADIQVGDTIKRTRTYKSGTVEVREGVVTEETWDYFTDGDTILAYQSDATSTQVTLELVNRPEPEPKPEPKLTDNAVIGDQIVAKDHKGAIKRVFTKTGDNRWATLIANGDGIGTGFRRTDAEVEAQFKSYATSSKL